jgi:CelD/BcsL family acetyltransferase involved in cellulose biosynthesis
MQATPLLGDVSLTPTLESGYVVEAITSERALRAAKDDWERLQRDALAPNVFTTWGWIWSWWCVFGRKEPATRLFIITARKAGRLAGIFPLVSRPTSWANLRKLEFPDLILADYMDPLLADDPAELLKAMFSFIAACRQDWDLFLLRRVRGEDRSGVVIANALRHAGLRFRQRRDEAYLWLPITGRFAEMRSSRSRETNRRKVRRLHEAGLEFRILEHPEREPGLLERMAEVERMRLVQGRAAGVLLGHHTAFFAHLFETLGAASCLYVGVVERTGSMIGYELGFRCGRKLWVYTKGYDPAYASLSPGSLLTAAIIDYGFEHRYEEYDMLRGLEEFKQHLSECLHEQIRFEVWNRSIRSQMAAGLFYGTRVGLIRIWWRLLRRPIHPDL